MSTLHVVGEAGDAESALHLARELRPDVAVIDIALRGSSGIELTGVLQKEIPTLAVLILTMYDSDEHVLQAIRAGARGYLLKNSPMKQITAAVEAVAAGGTYYSSAVMGAVCGVPTCSPLSQREQEILGLIVKGFRNKEIARQLNLSIRTIETHRQTIRHKLGAGGMADLIKYALKIGVLKI